MKYKRIGLTVLMFTCVIGLLWSNYLADPEQNLSMIIAIGSFLALLSSVVLLLGTFLFRSNKEDQ